MIGEKVHSTPDIRASCAATSAACFTSAGFHEQAWASEMG